MSDKKINDFLGSKVKPLETDKETISRLEAELKAEKDESRGWKESESTCNKLYSELLDENIKLIEYADHKDECSIDNLRMSGYVKKYICDCGLDDLLSTKGDKG